MFKLGVFAVLTILLRMLQSILPFLVSLFICFLFFVSLLHCFLLVLVYVLKSDVTQFLKKKNPIWTQGLFCLQINDFAKWWREVLKWGVNAQGFSQALRLNTLRTLRSWGGCFLGNLLRPTRGRHRETYFSN